MDHTDYAVHVYAADQTLLGSARFKLRSLSAEMRWWNGLLVRPDFDHAALKESSKIWLCFGGQAMAPALVLGTFLHNEYGEGSPTSYIAGLSTPPRARERRERTAIPEAA